VYFDTCYIAKFYLNEPESPRVRALVKESDVICSSTWAMAEFHTVLHRQIRERTISRSDARKLSAAFSTHIEEGLWKLLPVHDALLRRTGSLMLAAPEDLFLRTADAVHLLTAQEIGETEIWTNDRHMLAAAPYFGLIGKST
jgi:hypothetical protein